MGLMDIGLVVAMGPVAIASTALPNRAFHHPHAKATVPWIGLVLHDGTNCSNTRQKLCVPGPWSGADSIAAQWFEGEGWANDDSLDDVDTNLHAPLLAVCANSSSV